jgi:hypothetical protein
MIVMREIMNAKQTQVHPGSPSQGWLRRLLDTCFEYDDHLRANGHWAGGKALQPAETAAR